MNNQFIEAHQLIANAREAMRRGDKTRAQQLGRQAARLAPDMEDAWLILAASDPNPHKGLAYAQRALQINPQSTRAPRAIEWASGRVKQSETSTATPLVSPPPVEATAPQKAHAYQTAVAMPVLNSQGRNWLLPVLLVGAAVFILGFIGLFVLTANRSGLASILSTIRVPAAAQETHWAPVEVAKPEVTPIGASSFGVQAGDTPLPSVEPTQSPLRPTATPSDVPAEAPSVTPAATETPGSMVMEIVEDTPTNVPPTPGISVGDGVRWIDVDLTNQMVYAYEGETVVNSFVVSTGTWLTPTVTGKHKIYVKVRMQDMSGPGYHLKDVPYVMFFSGDYGLHGTYWHNNFGTPMSRGCVNLTIDDAAWLFDWASVGTIVNVHY